MKTDGTHLQRLDEEMVRRREEELRQVQDVRALYERKLETTQQLYNELSMCMEQLEVKQKELDRREKRLQFSEGLSNSKRRASKSGRGGRKVGCGKQW
jgi:hypothetical protein